jgi:hypothetical protein
MITKNFSLKKMLNLTPLNNKKQTYAAGASLDAPNGVCSAGQQKTKNCNNTLSIYYC